jgi:hypothetical protein
MMRAPVNRGLASPPVPVSLVATPCSCCGGSAPPLLIWSLSDRSCSSTSINWTAGKCVRTVKAKHGILGGSGALPKGMLHQLACRLQDDVTSRGGRGCFCCIQVPRMQHLHPYHLHMSPRLVHVVGSAPPPTPPHPTPPPLASSRIIYGVLDVGSYGGV